MRSLVAHEARDTIVINRDPAAERPAGERGRTTELLALGERATWSMLRSPSAAAAGYHASTCIQ